MITTEEWRPVVGFEMLYEVSSLGRVRHKARPDRCLKPQRRDPFYFSVSICNSGVQKSYRIHELVAAAFIGPRPVGKMVLHRDDDGTHNVFTNLRYGTSKENSQDAERILIEQDSLARTDGRLRPSDVAKIKALIPTMRSSSIASAFSVSRGAIDAIKRGRNWPGVLACPVEVAQLALFQGEYGR